MSMKIKIWGARGSLPSPLTPAQTEQRIRDVIDQFADFGLKKENIPKFVETLSRPYFGGFGGNTSCIEVSTGQHRLIIDAGSGLRLLGYEMLRGPCGKGQGEVDLLFTHFHWDHLIGLPFFVPVFIPGNRIRAHAVQEEVHRVFQTIFQKPYFPVPFEALGSKITTQTLEPRTPMMFGDLQVTPFQLDHPDPCWGFRIAHGGKVFSYCVDTEATRTTREQLGPDLPLYQGVDLMIFDSQYTLSEAVEKVDWGHSSATIGLDIAMRENIRKVIFIHHDPAASDLKITSARDEAARYYRSQLKQRDGAGYPIHEVDWDFGHEGMEFEL
ncbi:MBL fold metallo-hydrolase [bacterium]|jgi:phosphoribosyl 1,2-cyclic phosphodiesterase|nr:MBL fold metallo-hydrolase [bacterium]